MIYQWKMTVSTYDTYHELLSKLEGLPENTPEWHSLIDDLQSLPGYPVRATEHDTIEPALRSTH